MKKKKKCVLCGFPVGHGGDRHKQVSGKNGGPTQYACPPPAKPKKKAKRKGAATSGISSRGAPVAGIRKRNDSEQEVVRKSGLPERGKPVSGIRKDREKHKGHGGGAG